MSTAEYENRLGVKILGAALTNQPDQVDALLVELTEHTGNRIVYGRIAACWVDATLEQLGVGEGSRFQLIELPSDEPIELAGLPRDIEWCGRAIAARTAGDEDTWTALLFALPAEDANAREHLRRLVTMLAVTLQRHHAGAVAVARTADLRATPVAAGWSGRATAIRANAAFN